jgi:GST-like protein
MSDIYTPPKVWQWDTGNGGKFANINRPVSGSTHEAALPQGDNPFQLYSLATPNGVKVTVLFEELLEAGHRGAEYDAYTVNIMEGEQFGSDFVSINPNSKIPALIDNSGTASFRIFESGAMMIHLAEKFAAFIPKEPQQRAQCLSWLMWQMGSAPFLGGGFGHFYAYAPEKFQYPIDRYTLEVKRQLDVLDKHLATSQYMCGNEYTIADMAIWPWYGVLVQGGLYGAEEFLSVHEYVNVKRWADEIAARPAVQRGARVNRAWGDEATRVLERHSAADFN